MIIIINFEDIFVILIEDICNKFIEEIFVILIEGICNKFIKEIFVILIEDIYVIDKLRRYLWY